ncbi:hypothetical protein P4G85_06275 [Bacillus cereus]|uniref:Uncharacterized protein n=1 Tax=Bacillus cereus VD154 TaxID=1053238 RepID=A0A9W5NZ81_BACCE|nr:MULTISPECIES: hypothetical protein [Bacillus cereus group]MEB8734431.1 hypothetical protein [Bacillus cereus]EJR60947.1 hypothetical protein IK5_06095 [Bacillus cereus VD154]MEB8747978.1 hypothetical protein [Bacillus cereus]MEB8763580.1 hypothetical protein [Bacillus cereus]MEB8895493.1 hypothetical protein [Bacillus cereus]
MNYIIIRNADGDTGYMGQHGNGGGSKSAHGDTGHHFGWKSAHGNTGGSPIKEHGKGI